MLGRLATERSSCQANDSEQTLLAIASALFAGNERRALLVGVEQRDAPFLLSPVSAEMALERRLASSSDCPVRQSWLAAPSVATSVGVLSFALSRLVRFESF
jgi:hypothetical protein